MMLCEDDVGMSTSVPFLALPARVGAAASSARDRGVAALRWQGGAKEGSRGPDSPATALQGAVVAIWPACGKLLQAQLYVRPR